MNPAASLVRPARVLLPLGLGTALSLMGDATLYTVLPTHTAEAGVTLAGVGILLGANRAIRLLSNAPAGLVYDRYLRRRIFLPALFLGALSTAVYAATSGFWPLLLGRLLWGLAWSGIWVGGATMILDVTGANDRGRWTGLYQTWFFLGTATGALVGGLLTDQIGYSATMWVCAALTACGAIFALILLPETRGARQQQIYSRLLSEPLPVALRSNSRLWAAVTLQGINRFVGYGVLAATLALLVQQQLAALPAVVGVATVTGILMSSRTLFSMVSAPLSGAISDRTGRRWLVMAAAILSGLVGVLCMAWGAIIGLLVGIALTAISGGGVQAMATTLTGDVVSPAQRGRAIGLLHTAGDLGSALGPPIAYFLIPFVALRGVYLLCAAALAVGLVLSLWLHVKGPAAIRSPAGELTPDASA